MRPDAARLMKFLLVWLALVPASSPLMADDTPVPERMAVLVNDLGNDYFQVLSQSIRQTALLRISPDIRVTVMSSGYDIERQRSQLNQWLEHEPTLIILTAADPNAFIAEISTLQRLGHIVIAVDVEAVGALITVTSDNWDAGYQSCLALARALRANGKIALLDGPPVSSIMERSDGCEDALSYFPYIEIVDRENGGASFVGGIEAMSRLLSRNRELDGVFSINDPTALGASAAAMMQGKSSLLIASIDGSPAVVEALRSGEPPLLTTAAQFPRYMGERAVVLGWQAMREHRQDQQLHRMPVQMISSDNASLFCQWQYCEVEGFD